MAPMLVSEDGAQVAPGTILWGEGLMSAIAVLHDAHALFEEQTSHVSWLPKVKRGRHERSEVWHVGHVAREVYLLRIVMTAFSLPLKSVRPEAAKLRLPN